jgi:hypothetical protein
MAYEKLHRILIVLHAYAYVRLYMFRRLFTVREEGYSGEVDLAGR